MEKEMEGAERQKGLLDKVFSKLASRKLLVWLTATGALFAGSGLESEHWCWISIVYITGQTAVDTITALKGYK